MEAVENEGLPCSFVESENIEISSMRKVTNNNTETYFRMLSEV